MKRSFFQAAVASILLYGCTTWTLTKRLEKKLDGNYTRMLRAILNKSWRQHPTRHQLYGHLPPITKTIQVRRTRHAGHCWRSRDELISDVLLWTPTHGRAKAGRPARTYIQQLCEDTECCPEDLPEAMNDREKWRERVRDIRATSTTWWWWYENWFKSGIWKTFFENRSAWNGLSVVGAKLLKHQGNFTLKSWFIFFSVKRFFLLKILVPGSSLKKLSGLSVAREPPFAHDKFKQSSIFSAWYNILKCLLINNTINFKKFKHIYIYIYIYLCIYQSLRRGRMWHKIIF